MATDTEVKEEMKEIKGEAPEKNAGENGHSDVEKRIIRQIEYYFGDYNLLRDKFLKEQVAANEGWIPMETMVKFKRLAELSTDFDVILGALKKSSSGLMEVDEENKKIRRSPSKPVPEDTEEFKQKLKEKTVYCKGFPRETTTIDKVLEFFNQYDGVEDVRLRYLNNRSSGKPSTFKGSLTVLFSNKELADSFMNLPAVKYEDKELLRQWLSEWEEEKKEQFGSRNKNKKENNDEENKEAQEEVEQKKLPRGTVLKVTNPPEGLSRDDVKDAFGQFPVEVAYVEHRPEDKSFFVRLRGENDAKMVQEKLGDSKLKIKDEEVTLAVLEGDDEEAYLTKVEGDIQTRVKQLKERKRGGGRGRGRGRGRGGRGFKRSRSPGGGKFAKKARSDD